MSVPIPEPVKHGIEIHHGPAGHILFTTPCCIPERENRRRFRRGHKATDETCFCTKAEARANPHNLEQPRRRRWHLHLFRTVIPTRSVLYQACRCGARRSFNLTGRGGSGTSPTDPMWVEHGRLSTAEDWKPPTEGKL